MSKDNPLLAVAIQTLMSPAPNQPLLTIAATGDRIIQSHYESQASMESGVGVELSRCVYLSLDILNILLVLAFDILNNVKSTTLASESTYVKYITCERIARLSVLICNISAQDRSRQSELLEEGSLLSTPGCTAPLLVDYLTLLVPPPKL